MTSSSPWLKAILVVALFALSFLVFLGLKQVTKDPVTADPKATPEQLMSWLNEWNQGVLAMDRYEFAPAARHFRIVAEGLKNEPAAWANLGIATMNQDNEDAYNQAEVALRRALALSPSHPTALHCLGVLMRHLGNNEEAEKAFRQVLKQDPHDPSAHYYLATILLSRSAFEEAETHLKASIAAEPHQASAIKNLFSLYYRQGREDQAKALVDVFQEFQRTETGNLAGIVYGEMGRYGFILREFPVEVPAAAEKPITIAFKVTDLNGRAATESRPRTPEAQLVSGDVWTTTRQLAELLLGRESGGASVADVNKDGLMDVWVADRESLGRLYLNQGGSFRDATEEWGITGGRGSVSAVFGDFDQDGQVDLYVCCVGPNHLFLNWGNRFTDVTEATGVSGGDVWSSQAIMADLDSDGDLDIYVANLFALSDETLAAGVAWPRGIPGAPNQLFNNNRDGTFTDIAERTGTRGEQDRSRGVLAAFLDGDSDADLMLFNEDQPLRVYRNDRLWRFVDVTGQTGLQSITTARGAIVADLDQDLKSDLILLGPNVIPLAFTERRAFAYEPLALPTEDMDRSVTVLDLDLDGDLDLITFGDQRAQAWLRQRDGTYRSSPIDSLKSVGGNLLSLIPVDLRGDGALDVVATRHGESPLLFLAETKSENNWFGVELVGMREDGKMRANPGGIGSRVTVVAGTLQQTAEIVTSTGILGGAAPRLHFGIGAAPQVDLLSIAWPDDLIQGEGLIPSNQVRTFSQVYRKSSSCPLLFAWDGERYQFVTDFLGVGGLGFFISPGVYAPPDPTERVLIPNLVAKDGFYSISIHEAMEEILYLDEAFLWVVEHPKDLEIHPDERLAINGPAPRDEFFVFRSADFGYARAVTTREGPADPGCLRISDRIYQPGVRPDRRFLGYAEPQEIVLDFGDFLRAGGQEPLVLCIDGWVEYPYSHVNFAAHQAGLSLRGLGIDVEVAPGQWETFIDDLGYPAGMPRVMTFALEGLPRSGTGRIRLHTNIELFIDRLWLARDLSNVENVKSQVERRKVMASKATLKPSGYPREYSPDGRSPLLYDYSLMDPAMDYKTMAGSYTRFGDVLPLLGAADDQSVIMARAEEILVQFPASEPSSENHRFTFILDSTGYCKDMDLYTAFPHTVEPLPYLAMPSYPYAPNTPFPETEAHRKWRSTYNTRHLQGVSDGRTSLR